jgi:hypothetical protein
MVGCICQRAAEVGSERAEGDKGKTAVAGVCSVADAANLHERWPACVRACVHGLNSIIANAYMQHCADASLGSFDGRVSILIHTCWSRIK